LTDYFALLDEPRRPWLDPENLKSKFLTLSSEVHPDRVHGASESEKKEAQERYITLNAAYNALREPRTRLAHLLELERGTKPEAVQMVPGGVMDLFGKIGTVLRRADGLIAEKNAATSPMVRFQIFSRAEPVMEELDSLKKELRAQETRALEEVREIDARWPEATFSELRHAHLAKLESTRHLLNYLARWGGQLEERSFQLTL
jgi:curved DNA-binding protein CbpA